MDSNASFGGEVERNVSQDNDFRCAASFSKYRSLSSASPLCQTGESKGQRRRAAAGIGATALRSGPDDVRPIAYCRASLKARRRGVTAVSVRRRFTASHFRFRVSATSGRLGMVRVLLQLKVNRLCLVVDGTAGFDPGCAKTPPA